MKTCNGCGQKKEVSEFYCSKKHGQCKSCFRVSRLKKIYGNKSTCKSCGTGFGVSTRGDCRKCMAKCGLRECSECLETLPYPLNFHKNHGKCIQCYGRIARSRLNQDRQNEYHKEWNKKNPSKRRSHHLKHKFNLSLKQYDQILSFQGGNCAICNRPPKGSMPLDVDHDHKTGRIRGLLHGNCNRALGLFEDNPSLCRQAADYLEIRPEFNPSDNGFTQNAAARRPQLEESLAPSEDRQEPAPEHLGEGCGLEQ